MTVAELYEQIGGSYSEAKGRLMSDSIVTRFVCKYPDDPSMEQLRKAYAAGDDEGTFRAAHTLKGVCANLALTDLYNLASEVTEAFRPGQEAMRSDVDMKINALNSCYDRVVEQIRVFEAQK